MGDTASAGNRAPELRTRAWTLRRLGIVLFLGAHAFAVLVFGVPDCALRTKILSWQPRLPLLNTHQGERTFSTQRASPIFAYLAATGQGQRWQMFTPRRRQAMQMLLRFRHDDGTTHTSTLQELDSFTLPRWTSWRLMEWRMLSHLPYLRSAAVAIARRYEPGCSSVAVRKLSYEVPLLEDDGSGTPVFQSAAWFDAFLADGSNLDNVLLGQFAVPTTAPER